VELTPWSGPMAYNQRASQCKSQVRDIVMSCLSLAGCFWFCQTRVRTKLRTTATRNTAHRRDSRRDGRTRIFFSRLIHLRAPSFRARA